MPRIRAYVPVLVAVWVCAVWSSSAKVGGWDTPPNSQYHIQTDEGPERYFKYQTVSGQYRKERRLHDGTVVGTYGWVDADGFLRLRDYIADGKGYRIVRTKMLRVGVDTPIDKAVSAAKKVPAQAGVGVEHKVLPPPPSPTIQPVTATLSGYTGGSPTTALPPVSLSEYIKSQGPHVDVIPNAYPTSTQAPASVYLDTATSAPPTYHESPTAQPFYTSTPGYVQPQTYRPFYNPNSLDYANKLYENVGAGRYESAASNQLSQYDGVAFTHNGFRYYLPRHYHEEETMPGDRRAGSFGYIDPFGIRRVIYYNSSPEGGFVHRKNNRYVGFDSTPYDPRY